MREVEFTNLHRQLLDLNELIGSGCATGGTLEAINNQIDYLNIQIEYEEKESPSDKLSYHYQVIELCWLYYRLRDYFISSQ